MSTNQLSEDSPEALLALARQLMERPSRASAGLWPRAAALLARQALEDALTYYWQHRGFPMVASTSARSQLLCLAEVAGTDVAGPVSYAWAALSSACHARAYELAPTAPELADWIDIVATFVGGEGSPWGGSEDDGPPV